MVFSPSAGLNYFTASRENLAVPCQDEEGNLNFPPEMGGAEALWCSELLPRWAELCWAGGQRAPGQPEAKQGDVPCWCSWREGRNWLGRAGRQADSSGQGKPATKTGQNHRPEVSQIDTGCTSALKSLNNFLARG